MEDFNLILHIENAVNKSNGELFSPQQSVDNILSALASRKVTFLELVDKMGLFILSPQENTSNNAKDIFIDLLKQLPKEYLKEDEVLQLLMFFNGIINSNSIGASFPLNGLKTLCECKEFPVSQVSVLFEHLTTGFHIPSLVQKDRFALYQIVAVIIKKFTSELKLFNDQFLNGFVQMIDGERDPQCLHLLFQLILPIAENFSISLYVEELFEILSCYFPIDFTPPPNDPNGISRQDLVDLLEKSLTCTPEFGPHVLPLVMEKLDADVIQAKLDSLHLLCEGCSVYSLSSFQSIISTLWSTICSEIMEAKSEEVKSAALFAVTQLVKAFSKEDMETDEQTLLEEFIGDIWQDSKHHLLEPKLRSIHPAAQIIQHAIKGSSKAYSILGEKIFPLLVEMFQTNKEFPVKGTILGILTDTLTCSKEIDSLEGPAIDTRDQTIGLFFAVLQELDVDLVVSSLKGMSHLIDWTDYFSSKYIKLLVGHLLILLESSNPTTRTHANGLLKEFVKSLPLEVSNSIYTPFLNKLNTEQDLAKVEIIFEVLSSAYISHATLTIVLPLVLEYSWKEWTNGTELYKPALFCLSEMASHGANEVFVQALPILISLGLQHPPNSRLGEGCCSAIESIVEAVDSFLIEYLVDELFSICINNPSSVSNFQQLEICKYHPEALGSVLKSTVATLDRRIIKSNNTITSLLLQAFQDASLAPIVASLINKCPPSQASEFVDTYLSNILSTAMVNKNLVKTVAWLAKALVIRGHPYSNVLNKQLMAWLEHPEVGDEAAEGFGLIQQEFSKVLNIKCNANVNLFYKQKFYLTIMPQLVEKYQQTNDEFKCNYLVAMTSILIHTPSAVIKDDVSKLMPTLVNSLLPIPENQRVLSSLLSTIILFVKQSPNVIIPNLKPLIVSSLTLSSSATSSMNTRMNALELLKLISNVPEYNLIPFRSQVIKQLLLALEDNKRVVRRNAYSARNSWYFIGQPIS